MNIIIPVYFLFYMFYNKKQKTNLFVSNKIECIKCINKNISDTVNYDIKKLISISPGGYKGVYMLGTCTYIKEKYDTKDYLFSGASAGAWNSLMMVCKKNFIENKKEIINYSIENSKNINDLQNLMKKQIMKHYKTEDFDLDRLYIGVTTINKLNIDTKIYYNFENLEDAIDCCIASSHIPMITGGIFNKYKNVLSFDGGFSNYPYLHKIKSIIHITPNIWNDRLTNNKRKDSFTTLFFKNRYNFDKLFEDGYEDAKKNKDFLDSLFLENDIQ
jgi:hypothetical protein